MPTSELDILDTESIGISIAPENLRLAFIRNHIDESKILLRSGAHRPHVSRIIRQVIYYQWERPQLRKHSLKQFYSARAWEFRTLTRTEKQRQLRYDHAIPMGLVVEKILSEKISLKYFLENTFAELLFFSKKINDLLNWDSNEGCPKHGVG